MANEHEYDDDVFTLEEDIAENARKQKIQYAVMAVLAVLVLAVAMFFVIFLTNSRIERQALEKNALTAKQEAEAEAMNVNYWPGEQFPDIPVFSATEYKTSADNGRADIIVPPVTAAGFGEYAQQLLDGGAQLYIDTPSLTVLSGDGVEVHLVDENNGTRVVLCGETGIVWDGVGYEAFPLPDSGSLVSVVEGAGAGSRVLTYRNTPVTDALAYVNKLAQAGWAAVSDLSVTDNRFSVSMKMDNRQITVDYFSSGDNYVVKFDYLG